MEEEEEAKEERGVGNDNEDKEKEGGDVEEKKVRDVCLWDISSTVEKKSRSVGALRGFFFFHLSIRAMTQPAGF